MTTVARVTANCASDIVGEQEVRWDRGRTERAGDCTLSFEMGMRIINY
jgi:hypothetical protein